MRLAPRLVLLVLGAALLAPAATGHVPPLLALELRGPDQVLVGERVEYGVQLRSAGGAGVPGASVEILLDGEAVARATTRLDGTAWATLRVPSAGEHVVEAVAYPRTPLATRSAPIVVHAREVAPDTLRLGVADLKACVDGSCVREQGARLDASLPASEEYEAWVRLEGWLGEGAQGAAGVEVRGEVWQLLECPEGYACAASIEILKFTALTGNDGAFSTWVGPFRSFSPPDAGTCVEDRYVATAAWDGLSTGAEGMIAMCAT